MTERKIIITADNEPTDKFTQPICTCETCKGMNTGSIEWETFSTKNNLQRRMKEVVARIETREAAKITSEEPETRRPKKRARR